MRDITLLTLALAVWLIGAANIHASHYTSGDASANALADVYGLNNTDVAMPVVLWRE